MKETDSLLHKPEREEHFNWGSAKAYSNFRAYFQNSKLIFINEDYRYRQPGDSFNRYYYKDGNMLFFIGKKISYIPGKQLSNLELMVDPDDRVIAYDKMIDGQRMGLEPNEAEEIIEHAKELRDVVEKKIKNK